MSSEPQMKRNWITWAAVAAILALLIPAVGIGMQYVGDRNRERNREEDREHGNRIREEDRMYESTPSLSFMSRDCDENGHARITVQSKNGTGTAVVHKIEFQIDDSDILDRINQRHPRKERPIIGDPIPVDPFCFRKGYWSADGTFYYFASHAEFQIQRGDPNVFELSIANERWKNFVFTGTVHIYYGKDESLLVPDIKIVGEADLSHPPVPMIP